MDILREQVAYLSEADGDARTAPMLLIQAGDSQNPRRYPAATLRKAAPLFEGLPTFLNHAAPNQRRGVDEVSGWVDDVSFDESRQALVGTRHFAATPAGDTALALARASKDAPKGMFGPSINAFGRGKNVGGMMEVQEITRAKSVDDVLFPAAGGEYLNEENEQGNNKTLVESLLSEMTYDEWLGARADYKDKLSEELAADGDDGDNKLVAELQEQVQARDSEIAALKIAVEEALEREAAAKHELLVTRYVRSAQLPREIKEQMTADLIEERDTDKWDPIFDKYSRMVESVPRGKLPERKTIANNRAERHTESENVVALESYAPRAGESYDAYLKRAGR